MKLGNDRPPMKFLFLLCVSLLSLTAQATKLLDPADLHSKDGPMMECFSASFSSLFQQFFGVEFNPTEFRVSKAVTSRFEDTERAKIIANPEEYQGSAFYFNMGIEVQNSDCRISFYTQNYGETGAEYNLWMHPTRDSCVIHNVKIDKWIKLSTGQRKFLPNPYFIYDLKNLVHDESGKLISFDETILTRGVSNIRFLPEQIFFQSEDLAAATNFFVEPRKIRDCLLQAL